MEVNLMATFSSKEQLEQTAEILRLQGVLDIQFNNDGVFNAGYQANSFIEFVDNAVNEPSYSFMVSVEKSRYRQAEDTIINHGGQLHGSIETY